jgi:hypothetical protein
MLFRFLARLWYWLTDPQPPPRRRYDNRNGLRWPSDEDDWITRSTKKS